MITENKADIPNQNDMLNKDVSKILGEFYDLAITFREMTRYQKYIQQYNLHNKIQFCGEGIVLGGEGNIEIGNDTYIGSYTRIITEKGTTIKIGNNVSISHFVSIYTVNRKPILINENNQEYEYECSDVSIGDYSLIGINAVIMQGVNIGKNCFVGANSVVTHSIPDNTVVAGNPARIIKTITE